jgi:hypothetical protein
MLALIALVAAASPAAVAQTSTPTGPGAASQARPTRGPEQTSVSNAAPAATTGQTTAAKNQDPTIKQMNEAEKSKVEKEGK